MRVIWSEPAEFDLEDLYDYIAKDSPIDDEQQIIHILALIQVRQNLQSQDTMPWD